MGLAIEVEAGGTWRTVASEIGREPRLALALPAGSMRLRVWSVDRRGDAVQVSATAVSVSRIDEASLAKGIRIAATPGLRLAPALLQIERSGAFHITGDGARAARHAGEPLEPLRHGVATADGAALWLLLDAPTGEVSLQGSRVELTDQPLQVTVSDAATLDLSAQGLALVLASSAEGWPLVQVLGAAEKSSERSVHATAVAPHASAAVGLTPGRSAAQVWLAGPQPADVQVRRLSFARPTPVPASFGIIEGALHGSGAKAYSLPEGVKRLRLASTAGVVAAVASGDRIESVHWAGDEPLAETFETSGQILYLLDTGTEDNRFSVELLPTHEAAALSPAGRFEEVMPRAGTRRLPVGAGSGDIEVEGASAVFVSSGGRIQSGQRIQADKSGGTLFLSHGPGLVSARWRDGNASAQGAAKPVSFPARIALSGEAQAFRLAISQPTLLRIAHDVSADVRVTLVNGADGSREWLQPQGGVASIYSVTLI